MKATMLALVERSTGVLHPTNICRAGLRIGAVARVRSVFTA
jgi:hypothetical protein